MTNQFLVVMYIMFSAVSLSSRGEPIVNTTEEEPSFTTEIISNASGLENLTELTTSGPNSIFGNFFDKEVSFGSICCLQDDAVCVGSNTECRGCICVCQKNASLQKTESGELECVQTPPVNTTKKTKLKNLPNQPCKTSKDCVEGLVCNATLCACPSPCEYVEEELACDCGEEERRTGHIVVGVFLGLMIVGFWSYAIKSLITSHHSSQGRVRSIHAPVTRISTLGAAYGTDHIEIQPMKPQAFSLSANSPVLQHQAVAPTSPLRPAFGSQVDTMIPPTTPMVRLSTPYTPTAQHFSFSPFSSPTHSINHHPDTPFPYNNSTKLPSNSHTESPFPYHGALRNPAVSSSIQPPPINTPPPPYHQLFSVTNPAYQPTADGMPPRLQCPSSAPGVRRTVNVVGENDPDADIDNAPDRPLRSARF